MKIYPITAATLVTLALCLIKADTGIKRLNLFNQPS